MMVQLSALHQSRSSEALSMGILSASTAIADEAKASDVANSDSRRIMPPGSAQQSDIEIGLQIFPGAIGGHRLETAFDGEREAGAVGQG